MFDDKMILLSTLYVVLAMVLVSLDGTYNLTYNILSSLGLNVSQDDYGMGMKLKQTGFLIHIVVFAILVYVSMLMCKKN